MDKSIAKILGEGTLPEELMSDLQAHFEKKVAEAREQAEMSVREEFAARYDHDKANLVEAMDTLLSGVVQKHADEHAKAVGQFVEARDTFRKAVKEARRTYKSKLDENLAASRTFVAEKLAGEIAKLRETKKTITQDRLGDAARIAKLKESLKAEHKVHLKKIDEFVVRQVRAELTDFHQDHRALNESRAKLVAEGRKKLKETQVRFVKEAARNVEKAVTQTLAREMTQLHEDLERNRQNMFGRKIFEAMAAEFMGSHLAEGTEIRKLQNMLEAKSQELSETTTKLSEAVTKGQQAVRKVREAEDRAIRGKVLGELLGTLRGEKRKVMEGMLDTVKTENLRESFSRLLDVVLDERPRSAAPATRRPLSESERTAPQRPVIAGGNRGAQRLFENAEAETNETDAELAKVMRLAGITQK